MRRWLLFRPVPLAEDPLRNPRTSISQGKLGAGYDFPRYGPPPPAFSGRPVRFEFSWRPNVSANLSTNSSLEVIHHKRLNKVVACPQLSRLSGVPVGDEQTAADLAGDDTIERSGSVIIARLDQRYGLFNRKRFVWRSILNIKQARRLLNTAKEHL